MMAPPQAEPLLREDKEVPQPRRDTQQGEVLAYGYASDAFPIMVS